MKLFWAIVLMLLAFYLFDSFLHSHHFGDILWTVILGYIGFKMFKKWRMHHY